MSTFDINKEFEEIHNILLLNNYSSINKNLKFIQDNTFSSTEMLMKLVYTIKTECINDESLNNLLKENLENLLDYCKSIGIIIN